MRTEQAHPVPVGTEVATSRIVSDQASGRLGHHEPKEDVPGRRDAHHAVEACPPDKRANCELAYRAVQDRNAIVAVVEDADVAELVLGARLERLTVTIDRVAVHIQGDVVCPDHDAVVRTVDEVAVERRVGGDRGAAVDVAPPCSGTANDLEASHHKEDDHHHRGELWLCGVRPKLRNHGSSSLAHALPRLAGVGAVPFSAHVTGGYVPQSGLSSAPPSVTCCSPVPSAFTM